MRSLSCQGSIHIRVIQIELPICAGVRLFLKTRLIESKSSGEGRLSFGRIIVRETPTHIVRTAK